MRLNSSLKGTAGAVLSFPQEVNGLCVSEILSMGSASTHGAVAVVLRLRTDSDLLGASHGEHVGF